MPITGTPLNKEVLDTTMRRLSTKCHQLVQEIQALNSQMAEILDADIEAMYVNGGMSAEDAATARNDFRSWVIACAAWADNYSGAGQVLNRKFEIAKRVDPLT